MQEKQDEISQLKKELATARKDISNSIHQSNAIAVDNEEQLIKLK